MTGHRPGSLLRGLLRALAGISLAACGLLSWRYLEGSEDALLARKAEAKERTSEAAQTIDGLLQQAMRASQEIAGELGRGLWDGDQLAVRLRRSLLENPRLAGLGVAFEPYAHPSGRPLYAPYVERQPDGEPRRLQIEELYDYAEYRHRWYDDPILEGALWSEPFYSLESRTMLVRFGLPFRLPVPGPGEDTPSGIVFSTLLLADLEEELQALGLETTGYAFVFSREGQYVSHPRGDLVSGGRTVFETAWARGDAQLHAVAIHGIRGEPDEAETFDALTGRSSWIFSAPIPSAGWTLATVVFTDALRPDPLQERRSLFLIVLTGLGTALSSTALFLLHLPRDQKRLLWLGTGAFSGLLAGGMSALWMVTLSHSSVQEGRFRALDLASLESYLSRFEEENRDAGDAPPQRVPTGAFVKSIQFTSSHNVDVTGYVWQRYRRGAQAGLTRGFVLPEADKPEIQEVYRHTSGDEELIGWYFAATLRQQFSYESYPLDRHGVWLRLRPADLDREVLLIPDFASYRLIDPGARPGLEQDLVLPGWEIEGSYFDYRPHQYNTTFGLARFEGFRDTPELFFNVDVRRQVLGPLVSHVVPIAVVATMLFAILILSSKGGESSGLLGFSAMDAVLGCSALFFVVIFEHISLRESLQSAKVMYFECFYFTTYLALMLVSVNAILFALDLKLSLIQYEDNLLPKIAFWPGYLSVLFIATFFFLY